MGNAPSSPAKSSSRRGKRKKESEREQDAFGGFTNSLQSGMRKIEDSSFLDTLCGTLMDDKGRSPSYGYSEDISEDGSRTISDDDTMDEYDRRHRRHGKKSAAASESESFVSGDDTVDTEEVSKRRSSKRGGRRDSHDDSESFMSEDSSTFDGKSRRSGVVTESTPEVGLSKPLASSFAKRCYFTKAGIGKNTQHYEGLTLTGNVVLMLAGAMKLKGCPTICDEDLRRVEQTYPNQFSRLPDELLLSSGWRRISKYCHFSNKPIPDGVPFFHSKQRIHPTGGYYFLLAAAVGMIRPIEVEPLTRDTLVLLETDYPTQCDAAPESLIQDPSQWTLVDKFCFFSGGPINTEEDVYYQADFDGNLIFMLAFLSPSLTPEELYKLGPAYETEPGLKTVAAVEEVESVYDLTDRDFDDLKLYHLGPCRALPPYILQPNAWTKVLPPHFLAAKQQAMMRAHEYEQAHGALLPEANSSGLGETITSSGANVGTIATADAILPGPPPEPLPEEMPHPPAQESAPVPTEDVPQPVSPPRSQIQDSSYEAAPRGTFAPDGSFIREMEEEGAFVDSTIPIDEAIDARRKKRRPKHHPPQAPSHHEELRGPESVASSGHVMGSEAGTSFTGSYGDQTPVGEPPSLATHDGPEDEGGYGDEFGRPVGENGEHHYRESDKDAISPSSDGYYHGDQYYQANSRETGGSSDYYEREGEYYDDSPEKGHLRVHTALEQQGEYGQSPGPGSEGFIYSQESGGSEYSGGQGDYRQEDPTLQSFEEEETYDESPRQPHHDDTYSPTGETYDSEDAKHRTVDTAFSTPDDESYESPDYKRTAPPPMEETYERAAPPAEKRPPSTRFGPRSMVSPRSDFSVGESSMSEYSQTSAMRGAQQLLKKNRQKRLEMAMKKQKGANEGGDEMMASPHGNRETDDDVSAATSFVSGSSVWTDTSGADRGSRRALILQMAKARMKSNKAAQSEGQAPIAEETSIAESSDYRDEDSKVTAPTKISEMNLATELD